MPDNEPAFPVSTRIDEARLNEDGWGHQDGPCTWQFAGMSLRDYFAAKALQGILTKEGMLHLGSGSYTTDPYAPRYARIASQCYIAADAMLKARKK